MLPSYQEGIVDPTSQPMPCISLCLYAFLKICFYLFIFYPSQAACGSLAPGPGIEPMPPAIEAQILNHWTAKEVSFIYFKFYFIMVRAFNMSYPLNTSLTIQTLLLTIDTTLYSGSLEARVIYGSMKLYTGRLGLVFWWVVSLLLLLPAGIKGFY